MRFELRQAVRWLGANPGLAVMVVLTLGVGIGANATIFSLINALLLKSLPVRDAQRLVFVRIAGPDGKAGGGHSYAHYRALRAAAESAHAFDGLAAHAYLPLTMSDGRASERVLGELVSGNYFATLGVETRIGRVLGDEDDRVDGGHPVVVLSDGYWRRRFGGDARAVGTTIRLNGSPHTIIGVTPPAFLGTDVGTVADVRVPLTMEPVLRRGNSGLNRTTSYWLDVIGRLAPGVSAEQAAAPLTAAYHHALATRAQQPSPGATGAPGAFGSANASTPDSARTTALARERDRAIREEIRTTRVVLPPATRGDSSIRGRFSTPLMVLLGMVGAMLLIATANVANLLLTRAAGRRRELALRLALGATPGQLFRHSCLEGLLLASLGGLFGLALAFWLPRLFVAFLPLMRTFPAQLDLSPDARMLAFTATVTMAAGLLSALAPAWHSRRTDVVSGLKADSGSTFGGSRLFTTHRLLVVTQIAVSVVLLVGAGLFVRTLQNLRGATEGLDTRHLLLADIDPLARGYEGDRLHQLYRDLQQHLARLPGVEQASVASVRVLSNSMRRSSIIIPGEPPTTTSRPVDENLVLPGYFAAMGMTLLRGRDITDLDRAGQPAVAVINETMAHRYFAGSDPIGRVYAYGPGPDNAHIRIVGVVSDAKYSTLRDAIPPMAFLAIAQESRAVSPVTLHVRARMDAGALASAVRDEVRAMDVDLPVYAVRTMEAQRDLSLGQERMLAWLAGLFGLLALALAAVGLFGVLSYAVSRRTRDLGIRVALGADAARLRAAVLRETMLLALAGLAVGLPAAFALGRLIGTLLFDVAANDAPMLALAAATILATALLAGYLPARRATRVDPLIALRSE